MLLHPVMFIFFYFFVLGFHGHKALAYAWRYSDCSITVFRVLSRFLYNELFASSGFYLFTYYRFTKIYFFSLDREGHLEMYFSDHGISEFSVLLRFL